MAKGDSYARPAFVSEHEEVLCNAVRRLQAPANAIGGIGASSDPDRMRRDAKAAQTLTEELADELRELTGRTV